MHAPIVPSVDSTNQPADLQKTVLRPLAPDSLPPLAPRQLGAVNWIGLSTLTRREIDRFFKVKLQTLLSPVVSTLLFFLVFAVALGHAAAGEARLIDGIPYLAFLAPGLIMMSMAQNAFANTSSSFIISKVQGNIVDVLMPPLSPAEFLLGYLGGGVARGLVVGVVCILSVLPFVTLGPLHWGWLLYFSLMGSVFLSLLGILTGMACDKFDQMAAVTNFIIGPLTMLSGTFYSVAALQEGWRFLCHINPFFYMIDGFRFGLTGVADGDIGVGFWLLLGLNIALFWAAHWLLARGWKLRG